MLEDAYYRRNRDNETLTTSITSKCIGCYCLL